MCSVYMNNQNMHIAARDCNQQTSASTVKILSSPGPFYQDHGMVKVEIVTCVYPKLSNQGSKKTLGHG